PVTLPFTTPLPPPPHFYPTPPPNHTYTLSLHDALPIFHNRQRSRRDVPRAQGRLCGHRPPGQVQRSLRGRGVGPAHGRGRVGGRDRKSTRLNSSHVSISYAVFCLKKKIWMLLNRCDWLV